MISFAGSETSKVTSEFSLIELSLEEAGVDGIEFRSNAGDGGGAGNGCG